MNRLQQSGTGLGSDILLTLVVHDESTAKPLFRTLWAMIQGFEQRFSRFRADSELSRVNQRAGQPTSISPEFGELLEVAKRFSDDTDNLYSPLLLPALQRAGYVGSWPNPKQHDQRLDYRQRALEPVTADIVINKAKVSLPADTALDFGGIGKGYLLDKLAAFLESQGVDNYWLSLGGDLICRGFDAEREPWKVAIAAANTEGEIAKLITSTDGKRLAIATSGTTKRRGTDWHHIIDPRTGKPATTTVLTATVMATSATAADIYAKCLVIIGDVEAEAFIKLHEITGSLLQIRHTSGVKIDTYGAIV